MEDKYIVVSLKHSTDSKPLFWRANNKGYTYSPFAAGIYDKSDIEAHPDYYNCGVANVAIPLDDQALERIGFKCSLSKKKILETDNQ